MKEKAIHLLKVTIADERRSMARNEEYRTRESKEKACQRCIGMIDMACALVDDPTLYSEFTAIYNEFCDEMLYR